MALTLSHAKTDNIADWTQTEVDQAIADGALPPGTTPNDIVLSSDWNAAHTVSGTLGVANGGTGVATLAGIVKGNGTSAFSAAAAGTDYQAPIGTIVGIAKGNGANALTAAVAGTDYQAPLTAGTDYANLAFKTVAVSGQSDVVADSATDTLTLAAGANITITTDASTDTVTIAASGGGGNSFETIAVSGQSNVVADSSTDTLTLAAGTGIAITTDAGTDTVTVATTGVIGKVYLGYWPAAALKPSVTNGCDALAWDESTTNDVMDGYVAFSASADQYAQFEFLAPQSLDEGTFIAKFHWKEAASATAHNVVWQIEIQAQSDADTIDSAWGTAQTVQDTGTNNTTRRISAETSAITPGGTWAAGDVIKVRVSRKASDTTNDTLDVKAHLLGVTLYATNTTLVEP